MSTSKWGVDDDPLPLISTIHRPGGVLQNPDPGRILLTNAERDVFKSPLRVNVVIDSESGAFYTAAQATSSSNHGTFSLFADGSWNAHLGPKHAERCMSGIGVAYVTPSRCWQTHAIALLRLNNLDHVELSAIGYALEIAVGELTKRISESSKIKKSQSSVPKRVFVFTDSSNSLCLIRKIFQTPPKKPASFPFVTGILMRLICGRAAQLKELGISVELHWVRGHGGVEGNHQADLAAKEIRQEQEGTRIIQIRNALRGSKLGSNAGHPGQRAKKNAKTRERRKRQRARQRARDGMYNTEDIVRD